MRTWISLTCGDSQRKEKVRTVLRADKGIAGKGDGQRIWQNSTHRLPQLKQIKLAFFLETCCYGFKTFFFFFFLLFPPASCLSFCCRFKEIGGRCIVRWRTEKNGKGSSPYHCLLSLPNLWSRLWRSCSLAIRRESTWCSLCRVWRLPGKRVLLSHSTGPRWGANSFSGSVAGWVGGKAGKGAREQSAKSREKEAGKLPRQTEWRRLDENSNSHSQNAKLKQNTIFNRTAQLGAAGELKFWRITELGSDFRFSASSQLCSWPSLLTSRSDVSRNFPRRHLCTWRFLEQSYIPNKPFQILCLA